LRSLSLLQPFNDFAPVIMTLGILSSASELTELRMHLSESKGNPIGRHMNLHEFLSANRFVMIS